MSLCVSAASSPTQHHKGHAICTYNSPTIAVINTYFSDPNDNNNIYDDGSGSPTWKTCSSSSVCTEAPFTGTCSAVDSGNAKLGVKCPCATSNTFESVHPWLNNRTRKITMLVSFVVNITEGQFDEAVGVGKFNNLDNIRRKVKQTCKNCSLGKFNNKNNACVKTAVSANSTIWKANRTKQ